MDRTEIGSPYRILDQKTRAKKADKTFAVLSTLSQAVGGVYQIHQQDHEKQMLRRAKNDLVNDTINPDLQLHERTYAKTIAKGQALNTFHDLKAKVTSGEYDDLSPEEFQDEVNNLHTQKSQEYAPSTYASDATSAWNDFWVDHEATLTAGQAGKYRGALRSKEIDALGQNLVTKWKQNSYTVEDMIEEIESPDYSMLSTEDRRAVAFDAGALLAVNGDDTLLEHFDKEFNFTSDPKYNKLFQAASKTAHRKQRMITREGVADVRRSFDEAEAKGTLTWDTWEAPVNGGVGPDIALRDALDSNGNPIVSYREFSNAMTRSTGNLVKARKLNATVESIQSGVNTYGHGVQDSTYQDAWNTTIDNVLETTENHTEAGATIGQLVSKQTNDVKRLKNLGDTFANVDLTDPDAEQAALQHYEFLSSMKEGMNNNPKFERSIGSDAANRFKIIEHTGRYTVGTIREKTAAGLQAARKAEEKAEQGLLPTVTTIPDAIQTEIDEKIDEFLGEQDRLFAWDTRRDPDTATQDFRIAAQQHYKFLRNTTGLTPDMALERAIDETKGASMLFDGSLVMTWGAALPFNDSTPNIVKTIKNNQAIKDIVAAKYSTGETYDLQETPGLDEPAVAIPIPDWEEVRMIPDMNSQAVLFLDSKNELVHALPFRHITMMHEAAKLDTLPAKAQRALDSLMERAASPDLIDQSRTGRIQNAR